MPGSPPVTQARIATLHDDDSDVSSLSDWTGIEDLKKIFDEQSAQPEREPEEYHVQLPSEIEKTLKDADNDIRSHILSLVKQDQRYVDWDQARDEMSNIATEVRVATIRMGVLNKKLMQLQGQQNRNSEILQKIWNHLRNEHNQGPKGAGDEGIADLEGESMDQ